MLDELMRQATRLFRQRRSELFSPQKRSNNRTDKTICLVLKKVDRLELVRLCVDHFCGSPKIAHSALTDTGGL